MCSLESEQIKFFLDDNSQLLETEFEANHAVVKLFDLHSERDRSERNVRV